MHAVFRKCSINYVKLRNYALNGKCFSKQEVLSNEYHMNLKKRNDNIGAVDTVDYRNNSNYN